MLLLGCAFLPYGNRWYNGAMSRNGTRFIGTIGSHPMEVPTPLTRPVSPSDIQRNWKADQYGICGQ
jgi:hypothetical protein